MLKATNKKSHPSPNPISPLSPPQPCKNKMSRNLSLPHLLTLALLFTPLPIKGLSTLSANTSTEELFPVRRTEYRVMDTDPSGSPFQLCLSCRCCAAADPAECSDMSCCFGIDCNLPDKPYGVCAFMPTVCNCTSCS